MVDLHGQRAGLRVRGLRAVLGDLVVDRAGRQVQDGDHSATVDLAMDGDHGAAVRGLMVLGPVGGVLVLVLLAPGLVSRFLSSLRP